jgi:hypothetical protein
MIGKPFHVYFTCNSYGISGVARRIELIYELSGSALLQYVTRASTPRHSVRLLRIEYTKHLIYLGVQSIRALFTCPSPTVKSV